MCFSVRCDHCGKEFCLKETNGFCEECADKDKERIIGARGLCPDGVKQLEADKGDPEKMEVWYEKMRVTAQSVQATRM